MTGALRAGRRTAPMHGFLELDVTDVLTRLDAHEPPLSVTAFVIAAAGRAVAAHPEVHAYRSWRGRIVMHRHVDVSTIVEIDTPAGPFPLVHTIRDADVRSVTELSDELRDAKRQSRAKELRWARLLLSLLTHAPGAIRLMYALGRRSTRLRARTGTVTVTAIGMFADGGGFAVAPMTLMSLQLVIGGISERPRVVDGTIVPRRVLDLTVSIDHNVVDGAPTTRFGARLRREIEQPATL